MNKAIPAFCAASSALILAACGPKQASETVKPGMSVTKQDWGQAPNGTPLQIYTLDNGNGMIVRISNWGCVVQSIQVPDRNGNAADIVLGFDSIDGYAPDKTYQGAGIGRYGNRIGGAKFSLDGTEYTLTANDNGNCLHGGAPGFDKLVWEAAPYETESAAGLKLHRVSPDGENGFPGSLDATISLEVNARQELTIHYEATSDKATPVNLTHHMYWSLSGKPEDSILDNQLQILADRMTPVDETLIPTGEIASVEGTPFDFRAATAVGARIGVENEQLKLGGGYDHNFVFAEADGQLHRQVVLHDPKSGRTMEISTTEPAIQFYSGNFLSGIPGKAGKALDYRHGLCLETQHYPDSPNKPDFPDTVLRPGDKYESTTVFRFSAQ